MFDFKNKSKEMDFEVVFIMFIYYVIVVVYVVLIVIVFSLNMFVIWVFVKDCILCMCLNSLIFSIVVGDWLYVVLVYFFGVVKNVLESWCLSGGVCMWYVFIIFFFLFGIMFYYVIFFIECVIIINFFEVLFCIERKFGFIIVGFWLFVFFWSLFFLFGWLVYVFEGVGVCCLICW